METLWQTQRKSTACGLLSGVFLVTAVVLSRRISGDAAAFTSEVAACMTGVAASLVAILAASMPDLISVRLARPQRTMLISACGLPGVMLGLALLPPGSATGLSCILGIYVAAVLTVSAFESEAAITSAAETTPTEETVRSPIEQPATINRTVAASDIPVTAKPREERSAEQASSSILISELEDRLAIQAAKFEAERADDELVDSESSEELISALPFELNEPLPHPASNPDTTQWMSRSRVEGTDVAEGSFRVRFVAGQRLAPVHLPFSPPLADTPSFECEPADDSDLRFRTTAVHAYGVRIEVSRSGDCNEEATAEVAWMASAAISDSVAA